MSIEPAPWDIPDDEHVSDELRRIVLTPASSIKPRPVRWLWDGRLALGTLGLLAGREGLGKSTLGYWLAARVTQGELPGEYHGTPAAVLVAATEDSWEHTIVPRLIAAGADLDRVYRVDVEHLGHAATLSLPRDLEGLEDAARTVGAALLLLDPLTSRLGSLDTHKDAEVRQALEPLVAIADRAGMGVLGLMHHNKSGSLDPLALVMASKAFTAVARSVHTVVPDPDDENVRLFGTPKNNLGTTNLPTLTFTVRSAPVDTDEGTAWTGQLAWGEERQESIRDAMSRATPDEDKTATDEAADWLEDYIVSQLGTVASSDAKRAGKSAGHGDKALRRARQRLGVQVESRGFPRVTYWTLAVPPSGAPGGARPPEEGTTDATGPDQHSRAPEVSVVPYLQSPHARGHDCEGTTVTCTRPGCTEPARPDRATCELHRTFEPARRSA